MKVVLLHALPLDERMWESQVAVLDGHEVVAPRLYPLGSSMEEWADGVLALAGGGPLVLVGASMGGYCSLAIARRVPERVRAVLLAGSRPDADSPERRAGRAATIALLESEGAEGLWRAMRPRLLPPAAPQEVVDRCFALARAQRPDELLAAVQAIRDRSDSTDLARGLGDALLGIVGDRDGFVTPEELRALVPHVQVFRGAGHLPSLERPAEFNRLLLDFVARWT